MLIQMTTNFVFRNEYGSFSSFNKGVVYNVPQGLGFWLCSNHVARPFYRQVRVSA